MHDCETLPPGRALLEEKEEELYQHNAARKKRPLPPNLYRNLAYISDPYDPSRDYIGFVDPLLGVVLVDMESLDRNNSTTNGLERDPLAGWGGLTQHGKPSSNAGRLYEGGSQDRETENAQSEKDMHRLAYEKKMGNLLPIGATRPISGFAIKKGELQFSSVSTNAYRDDFHSGDKATVEIEEEKLAALVQKLNAKFERRQCSKCSFI
jgi:hypothetical protein